MEPQHHPPSPAKFSSPILREQNPCKGNFLESRRWVNQPPPRRSQPINPLPQSAELEPLLLSKLALGEATGPVFGNQLATLLCGIIILHVARLPRRPRLAPDVAPLPLTILRALTVAPLGGGGTKVMWSAVPGKQYQVQFRDEAVGPGWNTLPGVAIANGTTASLMDNAAGLTNHRFYRVVLLP
jgi:hypothetical protein